jgi:4-amino-4-deoxy-L-arabinose transferase-like glycosyltransferase
MHFDRPLFRSARPARGAPAARPDRTLLVAILLLAVALRLAASLLLPDPNFPDALGYRQAAHDLWSSGRLGTPYWMPLYPALVGLTGAGWGQLVMDIALSTSAVWLVYRLVSVVFADPTAALLAGLMMAIYPYFIFYAVVGLTESLFIALLLGAFLCWYRGAFSMAAVLIVLSILTRPSIELLVPFLVLYFAAVIHRLRAGMIVRHLLVYAAVYIALMSPWWLHNYRAYGTFVRLDLASGLVFYSGNNPLNRTGGGIARQDYDDTFTDSIADPVARDKAMWAAGLSYVAEHPQRFLELATLKLLRFWRLWPYAQDYASPLYVLVSLASFLPVLVLSVIYLLVWGWREPARIAPYLAWGVYLTLIHMIFISSLRYRLPLEPFMIMFAAVAITRFGRWYWSGASAEERTDLITRQRQR